MTNQSSSRTLGALSKWLLAVTLASTCQLHAQFPLPDDFNPGADNGVFSLAVQADGKILAGGLFGTLGGKPRSRIGRLTADGVVDDGFNSDTGNTVLCLAVQPDGKILDAGINGLLGRMNADGSTDSSFSAGMLGGQSASVEALAIQADGKILIGGEFTSVGTQPRARIARLQPNGALDSGFDPGVVGPTPPYGWLWVETLALQPDGKILVGGAFTTMAGESHTNIGRLNMNGTPDSGFISTVDFWLFTLAAQTDGRILVGGLFRNLGGEPRNSLGRLNSDGTVDLGFNLGLEGGDTAVYSLALQADGKVLVGGDFKSIGGIARTNIARLNANGTVDPGFDAGPVNSTVYSLALQADGKIVVGGFFTTLGGQPRSHIGRLNSTGPATQSLNFDGSTITWLRGGTSPEVWRTTFERSIDSVTWTSLGAGSRIQGGWQLTGLSLPLSGTIRARGYAIGGNYNASSWYVETLWHPPLRILTADGNFGFRANAFGFNFTGNSGTFAIVECTTNLVDWLPLCTNLLGADPFYFNDPYPTDGSRRFYRLRSP